MGKNKTLENFSHGILGKILIPLGVVLLFFNIILGLVVIVTGVYLKYKSKTYVHH